MLDTSPILLTAAVENSPSVLSWLIPSLITVFVWGLGQGFVKMFIEDAPPARFCLLFVVAKIIANSTYLVLNPHPDPFSPEGRSFMLIGIFAYILDGAGWILYFQSIIHGPITIVGTLSAAYPALTVIWAGIFLNENLLKGQYLGVLIVILCCLGLSYSPSNPNDENVKPTNKKWIPLAFFALLLWSAAQTVMKYDYNMPNANEVNMMLFNTIGGSLTLGLYGLLAGGLKSTPSEDGTENKLTLKEIGKSFLPMGMMASGDIGAIIAGSRGPISVVSPLTGSYPVVTLAFGALVLKEKITKLQWFCILLLLVGAFFSSADKETFTKLGLAFLT